MIMSFYFLSFLADGTEKCDRAMTLKPVTCKFLRMK